VDQLILTRRRSLLATAAILIVIVPAAAGVAWWTSRTARVAPGEVALERLDDYGTVPAFTLTERSGRRVTRDDLRGLVWVADFIYTECTESCPTQSLQFARLQQEFVGAADLRLVSVTVDPRHDTPEVLRRYAERYGAGHRWWFLTGDTHEIYCLAQKGFRLSVVDPANSTPPACGRASRFGPSAAWASHGSQGLVMHSARFVLVDREGRIRAYHLTTDAESLATLAGNVRTVLGERESVPRRGSR
jgi:cytochrome oxidase Cu insertion factor (SCO1/SenC/PrrC family)